MRARNPQVPARFFFPTLLFFVLVGGVGNAQEIPQTAVVRWVIDGDTIELTSGQRVRYIGINTPEVRRRRGGQWRADPEPFAQAATEANRQLVEGKAVTLEYDVQTRDRYGRLLAYVYVNGEMVNAWLLADGYAQLMTVPPNIRYVEQFRRLAREARRQKRGLWAKR